jgi:hypothetical protein
MGRRKILSLEAGMNLRVGTAALATVLVLLAPAIALAAHARGGTFTSTQADVHVAKSGGQIVNADINCKLRGGVTIEAISFNAPVTVQRSGSFTYRGTAFYSTAGSHRPRMTTASLNGKFVTPSGSRAR